MAGCGIDRAAVRAGAGNVADLGQRIEIEDADVPGRSGARDIKVAAVRVGCHVIEAAVAADQLDLEHLVRAVALGVGCACIRKETSDCCKNERL